MRDPPRLRRLVVIGYDGYQGIGAGCFRVSRQFDRLTGRIRACPRDHGDSAMRCADGGSDNTIVLSSTQGGRFARPSAHDQGAGSFVDLTMTETFERRQIEFARAVEWRRQRRRVTGEPQSVTSRRGHGLALTRLWRSGGP